VVPVDEVADFDSAQLLHRWNPGPERAYTTRVLAIEDRSRTCSINTDIHVSSTIVKMDVSN
jgi:hypothetical protein